VDRRLLELAIGNLLDNALKFSPDGSRCRLGAGLTGGDVHVRVEDDGIGIAQEHVGRIFDRFYQVDSSSTRRHGGVGLGLHLVKAVTEGAGGAIDVQTETGRGTRFALRFPVAQSIAGQQSDPTGNQLPDQLQRASMM
jgi:signal transduction histidine kinase